MKREIIEKLYKEAADYCVEQHKNLDHVVPWMWEEKFAELIIKNCLDEIWSSSKCSNPKELTERIRTLFGMEP